MTQITPTLGRSLSAADDACRLLLRCVLHDAAELHFDAKAACPGCRALGGTPCSERCEAAHQAPITRYNDLSNALADHEGVAAAYPLAAEDRSLLDAALPEAITYRQEQQNGTEDQALLAAYRELAICAS